MGPTRTRLGLILHGHYYGLKRMGKMSSGRSFRCFLIGALAFAASLVAGAQSWSAAGSSPFLWSNQSPLGVYRSVNTMMMSRVPRTDSPPMQGAHPGKLAPLEATSFSRTNPPRMPQKMAAAVSKDARAEATQAYGAMLDSYDQLLRDSRQDKRLGNNVAGALTFLVTASHYAVRGGEELSDAQQEAILREFNQALALTPEFRLLADAQKQELFETAAISGAYILTMFRVGRDSRNAEQMKIAREVADLAVEQILGVPFQRLSLQHGLRVH